MMFTRLGPQRRSQQIFDPGTLQLQACDSPMQQSQQSFLSNAFPNIVHSVQKPLD